LHIYFDSSIPVTLYEGLPEKGIHLIRFYSKQKRRTQSKMKKFVVILVVNLSFIFLEAITATVVVYKGFSSRICDGTMWWIYRKSRDWKWPKSALTGSRRTGSDPISRDIEGIPSGRACETGSLGFPPFLGCFWICCVVLHVPTEGTLGCSHAQPEVGVSRALFLL
jgi:hypothetical protein